MKNAVADVVVVGAGVAGLSAALHATGRRVVLLTKAAFAVGGSSPLAQGGVAAALGEGDSPEEHARDTVVAGAGLCQEDVVRTITAEGPLRITELLEWDAAFDRDETGRLQLGREGAHGRRRVAHAGGDATGAEIVRVLAAKVENADHIEILEYQTVIDLPVERGRVVGVVAVDREGRPQIITAAAVVLATGGVGGFFARTTNPAESTGSGLALAARVGARLAGLEFVQFHPTALDRFGAAVPLLTEALRGEGAYLVTGDGHRFMLEEHPAAELAPRDIVARAIERRRRSGETVFLDATALGRERGGRFRTVARLCAAEGLDPATDLLPVAPAAHYHIGGVVTDVNGRSTVPGLWACGEVGFTGLHGANRLASNSLLEALVVGARCGERLRSGPLISIHPRAVSAVGSSSLRFACSDRDERSVVRVRTLMDECAGVERSQKGLRRARLELEEMRRSVLHRSGEEANLLLVSSLIVRAAEARTESRGAHFRADFPWSSPCWRQNLVFEGELLLPPRAVRTEAVG